MGAESKHLRLLLSTATTLKLHKPEGSTESETTPELEAQEPDMLWSEVAVGKS